MLKPCFLPCDQCRMAIESLQALSPLDGRYHRAVSDLRAIFCEAGLMQRRLQVEVSWLFALSEQPGICDSFSLSASLKQQLNQLVNDFGLADAQRIKSIESTTQHDVKAIEYFIKEKIADDADAIRALEFVHFACTSEDINNLAYALMLKQARQHVLLPALDLLLEQLQGMICEQAHTPMIARTHGQRASPTTLGKEWANVLARLERQRSQLSQVPLMGKFNGAVGNFNAHHIAYPQIDWLEVSQHFVESLGLHWNAYTTQIEPHDGIAELCDAMRRINVILIDFARDTWGYISLGYFKQAYDQEQVGSSTMPHKINPIDFENAEGNLGIANALFGHFSEKLPISRWQRDLSDSTVMRSLGSAFAYSHIAWQSLQRGLTKLSVDRQRMDDDLNQSWEVLAEAIQTIMRQEGLPVPYEQLKKLTQGQRITPELLHHFIQNSQLSTPAKNKLMSLSPQTYTGLAGQLADHV
jgi:adenylosuccinate lyase